MRGKRRGNAAHRASRSRTPPLRAITGAQASPSAATLRSITGLQRRGFWGSPCVSSSVSGIRTPNLPLLPVWEKGAGVSHRGRFLGKPLRAIFRFRHQDAQPPPSPLCGRRGQGDEGQKARECSKPHIAPQNSALERRRRLARMPPGAQTLGAQTLTRAGRSRSVANSVGGAAPLLPPIHLPTIVPSLISCATLTSSAIIVL